jgi:GxxExxY protein
MPDQPGLVHGSDTTHRIIGAAIRVHRSLGPGLLESIYEECLCHEFTLNHIRYERQKPFRIRYNGFELEHTYRADLLVEDDVIVEVKSVEQLLLVHHAQVLTYMRLTNCHVGLLLNFNSLTLKSGLKRFVR